MRLVSLDISGFRGFSRQQHFDFDADAIVVVGANGHGKTSLFDAVLWALSNRIPRLGDDPSRVVSLFAESGQARVALTVRNETGQLTVTRSFDGKDSRVALESKERSYQGPSAEGRIIDLIWPDAAAATDPREALAGVITKSVYLQQDLVRHFIEASSDQERFAAVSELVGVGRVTELQGSLERAKRAWSTATNQRIEEMKALRQRLTMIESRLSETTSRAVKPSGVASGAWNDWWKNAADLGVTTKMGPLSSREASSSIDEALKQLDALRRSAERRQQSLQLLQTDYAAYAREEHIVADVEPLRTRVVRLRKEHAESSERVEREQAHLAELRRLQTELAEKSEQLKTLASLALKHLEDRCPVCGQTYDKQSTRRRLEKLASGSRERLREQPTPEKLPELLAALEAKRKELAATELALKSAEQTLQRRQLALEDLRARATSVGLDPARDLNESALNLTMADARSSTSHLTEMQKRGEGLALSLAQSSGLAALDELRFEGKSLQNDIEKREKEIAARNRTGERAQSVIEALREAGSAVVQERLAQIAPILQDVYTRIDPHPAFRVVTFLSRIIRGKGQLSTVVTDPIEQKNSNLPSAVLSSSQVNALAVAVFLALNIGIPTPPLSMAMLDDPLQSLDDINLLGLVDLLRRTKDKRQLIVSTHDARFGSLMARKLRPRTAGGRTVVIELEGWSRRGPVVSTREVRNDPVPLRLAAAAG